MWKWLVLYVLSLLIPFARGGEGSGVASPQVRVALYSVPPSLVQLSPRSTYLPQGVRTAVFPRTTVCPAFVAGSLHLEQHSQIA